MSGGFAELIKLSKSQTAQSELAIQSQIANHQVQLEKKRREQEVRERRERELEAKLRLKRFEEQRKEEERKRKREEEERSRERELARREEQMRDALKHGPRKSSATRSVSSRSRGNDMAAEDEGGPGLTREELREQRNPSDVLTREEKRQRKLAAELRRSTISSASTSRRKGNGSTTLLPDGRAVRRLPGGAVDYTTISRLADPDASPLPGSIPEGKSARERLAAMPSTLTKLNTIKRDLRTIDEILIDRAKARKAKTLDGDAAKEFSDWFGKSKKKDSQLQPQARPSTPPRGVSSAPGSASSSPAPPAKPPPNNVSTTKSKPATTKSSSSFFKPINPKPSASVRAVASSSSSMSKKRPRSPSLGSTSPPPPPPKRRPGIRDFGSEIWSLFGKDKRSYVARDVLSDDEDMEADAASVLKEEQRSARLAHKEDIIALAEERRHEEEKRRRRRERERRERERAA